jgi:hypothetical protein
MVDTILLVIAVLFVALFMFGMLSDMKNLA